LRARGVGLRLLLLLLLLLLHGALVRLRLQLSCGRPAVRAAPPAQRAARRQSLLYYSSCWRACVCVGLPRLLLRACHTQLH
jgi:hypothetical protein